MPTCDVCGKDFDTKEELIEHAKKEHPEEMEGWNIYFLPSLLHDPIPKRKGSQLYMTVPANMIASKVIQFISIKLELAFFWIYCRLSVLAAAEALLKYTHSDLTRNWKFPKKNITLFQTCQNFIDSISILTN